MRALRSSLLSALLLMLCSHAAVALDPRDADILGLRLGMPQSEIVARLLAQGIARVSIQAEQGNCVAPPAQVCTDRIIAPTRDGTLFIRFVAGSAGSEPMAWSIAYTLSGRLPGEPAIIRNAVIDHFGQPNGGRDPAVWCARVSGADCSPADQPQITFHQGPGTSSTLTLIDPTAIIQSAPRGSASAPPKGSGPQRVSRATSSAAPAAILAMAGTSTACGQRSCGR